MPRLLKRQLVGSKRGNTNFDYMPKKGQNGRDLPSILNNDFCIKAENYIHKGSARLEKRGGSTQNATATGGEITFIEKFYNNIFIIAYDSTAAIWDTDAGTITTFKTDFTTSDPFTGVKYGDYIYMCNGGDKIGYTQLTLDYDAQTANFTVGTTLTGGTSGATATILSDSDSGTTGTLTLGDVNGTFVDNETITDSSSGSATSNGALSASWTELTNAPKAKVLKIIEARLFAGNTDTDKSQVKWSEQDDGTGVPFTTWTAVGTPPTPTEASSYIARNLGAVQAIGNVGNQIVLLHDDGKLGFRIETIDEAATGLAQYSQVDFQSLDFGGFRGVQLTPIGLFYTNEFGVFVQKTFQGNVKGLSEDVKLSDILGTDTIKTINFDDSDITYLPDRRLVLITCENGSTANNYVLCYDIDNEFWSVFTGWTIGRFYRDGETLWGGDSLEATTYKLFDGYDDNGVDIYCKFYTRELTFDDPRLLKNTKQHYFEGKLSAGTSITVSYDIWDRKNILTCDKQQLVWSADNNQTCTAIDLAGYGEYAFGEGNDVASGGSLQESMGHKSEMIRNYLKMRIKLEENSQLPHELHYYSIDSRPKKLTRKRNILSVAFIASQLAYLATYLNDPIVTNLGHNIII